MWPCHPANENGLYNNADVCTCNLLLQGSNSITFVSWDGANYDLRLHSSSFIQEGYYEIAVEDLGIQPDDHGNTYDTATSINPNGDPVEGTLQYDAGWGTDEDWFHFTALDQGLYEMTMTSQSGYKYFDVYGLDNGGQLELVASFWTTMANENIFISQAGTY